jgi:hypothetical protein
MLGDRRGLLAAALVLTLGLAACGGGSKKKDDGQYGSDLLTATTVTVAPQATTSPPTTSKQQAATAKNKPKPVTVPTRSPTTVKTGDPIKDASHGGVGDFAGPLLAKNAVTKIVYELLLQEGLGPNQHTLDHVTGQLKKFSGGKTIQIERTDIPPGPTTWNTTQLHSYADKYGRFKTGGDTAVLHVLFVHGSLPGAAGVATRADVLSMFPDSYKGGAPTASEAAIEDVVTMHETGHILGLIDLWLDTGRGDYKDDPAPGGHHSANQDSVMFWRVETLDVKSFFRGGPPTEFDSEDQADLMAIHNGKPKGSKTR